MFLLITLYLQYKLYQNGISYHIALCPQVYIRIFRVFGVSSQALSTSVGTLMFGGPSVVFAMGFIDVLDSLIWAHPMMTVGLEPDTTATFSAITTRIAFPTDSNILNCQVLSWVTHFVQLY